VLRSLLPVVGVGGGGVFEFSRAWGLGGAGFVGNSRQGCRLRAGVGRGIPWVPRSRLVSGAAIRLERRSCEFARRGHVLAGQLWRRGPCRAAIWCCGWIALRQALLRKSNIVFSSFFSFLCDLGKMTS
jgi:hypothetical protein